MSKAQIRPERINMIYTALHLPPEDLLRKVGFEEAPDKGWQIVVVPSNHRNKIPRERLHAQCYGQDIKLHFDQDVSGEHKARSYSKRVVDMIKQLAALEKPSLPPLIN